MIEDSTKGDNGAMASVRYPIDARPLASVWTVKVGALAPPLIGSNDPADAPGETAKTTAAPLTAFPLRSVTITVSGEPKPARPLLVLSGNSWPCPATIFMFPEGGPVTVVTEIVNTLWSLPLVAVTLAVTPLVPGAFRTVEAYPFAPVVTEVFVRIPRLVEKVMVAPLKGLPFTSSAWTTSGSLVALGAMI